VKRILFLAAILGLVAAAGFAQTATDNHTVTITIARSPQWLSKTALTSRSAPLHRFSPVILSVPYSVPNRPNRQAVLHCPERGVATRHITVATDVAIPPGTRLNVVPVVNAGAGTASARSSSAMPAPPRQPTS